MTFIDVIYIIFVILASVTFGFMLYFKAKGHVLGAVSELIALAETTGLPGSEKMAKVVAELYGKVPAFLKKILNKEKIEIIAQWIFDWMRKYADEYKKALEKEESVQQEEIDRVTSMARAELIVELIGCTVSVLKERAKAYGVELDGTENKKELMEKIVVAIMNKA